MIKLAKIWLSIWVKVNFVFADIDLPFVVLYFGSDDVEAKRLYYGVRALCNKEY